MSRVLHIIDPQQDAAHGWQRFDNYQFAARDTLAPVLLRELSFIIPYYPIAFVQNADDKRFSIVAVQGIHSQDNLYVNRQGLWMVDYIPSIYRGYPFALEKISDGQGQSKLVLAFNKKSGLFREAPGQSEHDERFFDEHGHASPLVTKLLQFLVENTKNRIVTQKALNALVEAKLLKPWQLSIDNPDPSQPLLKGLFCINQEAVSSIESETLKKLYEAGALQIMYAQLFSMSRISVLRTLHIAKYRQQSKPSENQQQEIDLEALFGEKDDIFQF